MDITHTNQTKTIKNRATNDQRLHRRHTSLNRELKLIVINSLVESNILAIVLFH